MGNNLVDSRLRLNTPISNINAVDDKPEMRGFGGVTGGKRVGIRADVEDA